MSLSEVKKGPVVRKGKLILSGVIDLLMSELVIAPKWEGHGLVEREQLYEPWFLEKFDSLEFFFPEFDTKSN